jgi:5-methyltetrahydrofolate--homocysteine methyltransferase
MPDALRDIHLAYYRAGADIVETNTFSHLDRPGRLRHGGDRLRAEPSMCARLAREALPTIARKEDGRSAASSPARSGRPTARSRSRPT